MKRLALIMGMVFLVVAATGCRRRVRDEDTVVVTADTLVTGVWDDDPMGDYTALLARHQEALRDVFFEYDSNELNSAALEALMFDAGYLMSNTGFRVLLEGHCDERGTVDYNLALGERRAQAVYQYLTNYGIPSSRLQTVSYGKERPFVRGSDEYAHSQNRRVHLRVLPE
jgi:peptidoglycan-associated lipoprotein